MGDFPLHPLGQRLERKFAHSDRLLVLPRITAPGRLQPGDHGGRRGRDIVCKRQGAGGGCRAVVGFNMSSAAGECRRGRRRPGPATARGRILAIQRSRCWTRERAGNMRKSWAGGLGYGDLKETV